MWKFARSLAACTYAVIRQQCRSFILSYTAASSHLGLGWHHLHERVLELGTELGQLTKQLTKLEDIALSLHHHWNDDYWLEQRGSKEGS